MQMQEAFRLGGWGMYPTAVVGLVLVIAAGYYALNPARARLHVVIGLGVLALLVSTLGFVTGVIKTAISIGELGSLERGGVFLIGFGESLVNVGFGLALLVIASIAVVVGLARRRPSGPSALVDPLRG